MSGDNLNVLRDAPAGSEGVPAREGLTRSVQDGERRDGRSGLPTGRARFYRYDRTAGLANATLRYETDKTDRMPVGAAVEKLEELHRAHGVDRAMEGTLYDYDQSLFICYAINGASQVGPMGRVKFKITSREGVVSEFEYSTVMQVLGIDSRRFFRTYANDVVTACRDLYFKCDFGNEIQVEMREMMIQLANRRGIPRYPYLVSDSVDAATNVSPSEDAAIMVSKMSVIGATTNAVDRRNQAVPIRSLDGFDSSVNHTLPGDGGVHPNSQVAGQYYS